MEVKTLEERHPLYLEHASFWEDVDLLYEGGYAMKAQANRFLLKRPVEAEGTYSARLERFSYQNILSTGLGWYMSKFFKDLPAFHLKEGDKPTSDEYFGNWIMNADRKGNSLGEMARDWFLRCLKDGCVYVLIDLPGMGDERTLREQRVGGKLDPYLITYEARQVINWDLDDEGHLRWAVIETQTTKAEFGSARQVVDRWYVFDRENYRVYEAAQVDGKRGEAARLVSEGRHSMANQQRVPILKFEVPKGLWLAYRVYPQVLDHLNQDNSYAWALFMANLAIPVIIGNYEEKPAISESAYLVLEAGSSFQWSEPAGNSFKASADRVSSLVQEIYRQMYLQAQSRDTSATASAQSGVSKEADMTPSTEVLNGYGAIFRGHLKKLIEMVASIRGRKDFRAEVQGLSFPESHALSEIDTARAALDLKIPSSTYEKYVQKKIARQYAANAEPDLLKQIDLEIDEAPTSRQVEEQKSADLRQRLGDSINKTKPV